MKQSPVERLELAPGYDIARVINGGWQLSHGHHRRGTSQAAAVDGLLRLAEAGFTTFDGADIYGGVEELFGRFLKQHRKSGGTTPIQIHTKCVPDLDMLPGLRRRDLVWIVERSLKRLAVERLDLVQFHWWSYDVPGYVEAAGWLEELRREGKIRHLGATNFDAQRLRQLLDAGIPLISNQVQYSLLDQRPAEEMAVLCAERGVQLLCYGSLAGGFLTDRYLGAAAIPAASATGLVNRSLTKYRLVIEEFGGWDLLQELLAALRQVADKHAVSIANVAVRWVLEQAGVAAAIVGTRTGAHLASNLKLFGWRLDRADHQCLEAVINRRQGPSGPVFGLERQADGRHRKIMKTHLNRSS